MKRIILLIGLIALSTLAFAQQPFEKYGYKVKIATLSNGKYVESFDQDTLSQIGSVIINRLTGKIVSFVTYDTSYSEATLQPELISRWISPDPLAEKYYSYSPYHFSGNNPIRFVDPDGRSFIDYYDQTGNKIGTDGNNDGRVVVVTDRKEAQTIKQTNKSGGTTAISNVKSGVELPSSGVRTEMGKAVEKSMNPTTASSSTAPGFVPDTKGGAHEEGGIFGLNSSGTMQVDHAVPGSAVTLNDPQASVDVFSGDTGAIVDVEGTFHTHPSINSQPGANTIGGETRKFGQEPSPPDYTSASSWASNGLVKGNSYVLATGPGNLGGQKVYIYNGNSTKPIASFPLKKFVSIK